MATAIDPKGEREFITEADRKLDIEQQTGWLLRDLTERARVAFMDSVRLVDDGSGKGALGGQGTRVYTALKQGLAGVSESKPFRDARGDVIAFETDDSGLVSDTFLERMAWSDKVEIADEIAESIHLPKGDVEK